MYSVLKKVQRAGIAAAAAMAAMAAAPATSADVGVGWIEIDGPILERPEPFASALGVEGGLTLRAVVDAIYAAAERPDVQGLIIRLRQPALTMTQVEEIGAAIQALRAAGKKAHLFTEIYGVAETALAAYVDDAMIQSGSALTFPGLYAEELYMADALRWLGVEPSFVQVGKYKGAEEPFVNAKPSDAWDQNYSRLLDELYGALRQTIKAGRGLSDAQLDRAMEEAWYANPATAIRVGLVDAAVDRLDVTAHLEASYGDDVRFVTGLTPSRRGGIDMANPFAFLQMLANPQRERPTRDTIAVLHIDGPIVDGKSQPASILGGASVGALTIREALKQIEDEPLVKGVVVRINSPGGSAIASESIWIGLRRVARTKPVWVSVGSMAASGGYYIASAGDRVYVNPSSIVGSIGVVGGKFALEGVYEKLRLNAVPRARGPRASLFSALEPWSDAERDFVRQRMVETYELFVDRVNRGRPAADIDKVGGGRLFAGESAVDVGLADALGALDDAVAELAADQGLREGAYDALDYPPPRTLDDILQDYMGFGLRAAGLASNGARGVGALDLPEALAERSAALAALLGPRAWTQLRDALSAMMLLRDEPVLLVAPRTLIFR